MARLLLPAALVAVTGAVDVLRGSGRRSAAADVVTCGAIPTYPNAATKLYADSRKASTDAGEKVTFKCEEGFTTDGTPDSGDEFEIECTASGFYEPLGACLKAPACGRPPMLAHAKTTGRQLEDQDELEYACMTGYSTDGKDITRSKSNLNLKIRCDTLKKEYTEPEVTCTPYSYVPAKEAYEKYSLLFETLFKMDCPSQLKKAFANGEPVDTLDEVCGKVAPQGGDVLANCEALVEQLRTDFAAKLEEREEYYGNYNGEGEGNPPNLDEEAKEFCSEIWEIIEIEG